MIWIDICAEWSALWCDAVCSVLLTVMSYCDTWTCLPPPFTLWLMVGLSVRVRKKLMILSATYSGQSRAMSSVVCLYVSTVTCELASLWPRYLACWFTLILSGWGSKVKVKVYGRKRKMLLVGAISIWELFTSWNLQKSLTFRQLHVQSMRCWADPDLRIFCLFVFGYLLYVETLSPSDEFVLNYNVGAWYTVSFGGGLYFVSDF